MQGNTIILRLTGVDLKRDRFSQTREKRKNSRWTKKLIAKLARTRLKKRKEI